MINIIRFLPLIGCLWAVQPLMATASPACPVQGLDNKVCPIVVNFFDDVAKQNPDFAKHWQNHHWVGQTGSNFSFSNLKLQINVHNTYSFTERRSAVELEKFINDTLGNAAKTNPDFQQVLDSHNFFVMTVQAMHLALQRGADHFNKSGAPLISLRTHTSESEELELTAEETYQVPTTDKYLNNAGIYFTDNRRYQHAVKIDSTTYKAGVTVAPVIVSASNPVTLSPKTSKIPAPSQQKTVVGAGGGSGQATTNQQNTNAPVTIQKQIGDRNRQGTQVVSTIPKSTKTTGSSPQKQIYIVQVPTLPVSKPVTSGNQQNANAPLPIQKQPGDRSRQGTPVSVTSTTNPVSPAPKGPKSPVPGQQKVVAGAGGGSGPATANQQITNAPVTIQKQPGDRSRQGTPVSVTSTTNPVSPAPKGPKSPVPGQQKVVAGAGGGSGPATANQQITNAPVTIQKQPGDRSRQGTPVSVTSTINPVSPASKGPKAPVPGQHKVVAGAGGGSGPAAANQQITNAPATIQKQPGDRSRQGITAPLPQSASSTNALRPSKVSIQRAVSGTNKSNVNNVLTTQKAGSQIDANERTYLIDENNRVWSCKLSSLGFRVTANSDGSITRQGHVETAHVKSVQLAHIPANHAVGSGCLISVHK